MANPMLYVVNTFREGMLGISDVSISFSLSMISLFIFIFTSLSLYLLHKGIGIREWKQNFLAKITKQMQAIEKKLKKRHPDCEI